MREFPADILQTWVHGAAPVRTDWLALQTWEEQDPHRLAALKINAEHLKDELQRRSQHFIAVAPEFHDFCQREWGMTQPPWDILWRVWLPLALHLADQHQQRHGLFTQGILGGQGTGKTTLMRLLIRLLKNLGYHAISLSLDDLYKTFQARQQLQHNDPRLRWRGPPGTHDVDLGLTTINQLKTASVNQRIPIPRFDKALHDGAGDRTAPDWVSHVDILLFEGWFVGVRPVDPTSFASAPEPIQTPADRQFALDINQALYAYLPLWEMLDSLWVLYPDDYRLSKVWRKQAEVQLRSRGQGGMSDEQIDLFVDYFWKALHPELFVRPLVQGNLGADLAILIQTDHQPGRIFNPSDLSR